MGIPRSLRDDSQLNALLLILCSFLNHNFAEVVCSAGAAIYFIAGTSTTYSYVQRNIELALQAKMDGIPALDHGCAVLVGIRQ